MQHLLRNSVAQIRYILHNFDTLIILQEIIEYSYVTKCCKYVKLKFQGYLWGGSAWTAENSDFQQALIIDLGDIKNVTGIATQVKYFNSTSMCDISFAIILK